MMITPGPWLRTYAELTCVKCGGLITRDGQDFEASEKYAQYSVAAHRCDVNAGVTQKQLDKAATVMKRLRALSNSGAIQEMTFEEECKVYNKILINQTF